MCRSEETEEHNKTETEIYVQYDHTGKIVATKDLQISAPWIIGCSKKFEGRYFFFNQDTEETQWSLPVNIVFKEKTQQKLLDIESLPPIVVGGTESIAKKLNDVQDMEKGEKSWKKGLFPSVKDSAGGISIDDTTVPNLTTPSSFDSSIDWNSIDNKNTCRGAVEIMSLPRIVKEEDVEDEEPLFAVLEGLGRGGYASVVKVEHLISKKTFAMKVISKNVSSSILKRQRHQNQLKNELKFMTEIPPCPFLQQCHFSFENSSSVFFVVDLIKGGDLFYHLVNHIEAGKRFSEQEACIILAELYLAVEHLHEHKIVHRDIKIENIMLDAQGHVKLVDYGLAVELEYHVQPMSSAGSLIYMAPELLSEKTGGRHTDWWAYGVLAHELLTSLTPWSSLTDDIIIKSEIHRGVFRLDEVSQTAYNFVSSLMCIDVNRRLGTHSDSEVKNASFFDSIDWVKTSLKETVPAFVPGPINILEEDKDKSLDFYFDIIEDGKPSKYTWSLGLEDASTYLFKPLN